MISKISDIGKIRVNNEDSMWAGEKQSMHFAVVADGMGGYNGGEVASSMLVSAVEEAVNNMPVFSTDFEISRYLADVINKSNEKIYIKSNEDETLSGMGTTATLAFVKDNVLQVLHVGDSRCYLYRKKKLYRITTDHSLVEELVRNGQITEDEAKNHPRRNVITRALGCAKQIEIDRYRLKLEKDDLVFMCTDGLSGYVESEKIEEIIEKNNDNYENACAELVKCANENGGKDNITVILFDAYTAQGQEE